MPNTPVLSLLTPVGRPEYEYLHQSARVLPLLNRLIHHHYAPGIAGIEWVIAIDDPGTSVQKVIDAVTFPERNFPVLVMPSTGEQQGSGATRNRALQIATGTWLMALDSDDILIPHGVLACLQTLQLHPYAWSVARAYDVHPDLSPAAWNDQFTDLRSPGPIPRDMVWNHLSENGTAPFCMGTVIAGTDDVRRIGGWPTFGNREDSGMISVLNHAHEGLFIPRYVMHYRKHPNAKTQNTELSSQGTPMDLLARMVDAGTTRLAE